MLKIVFKKDQVDSTSEKKRKISPKTIIKILISVVFLGLAVSSVFFYSRYKQEQRNNPSHEILTLIATISKFMSLPDEAPTLATITNKEELTSNALFKNAENGDKVLIFVKAQKAILYRPSEKKVIEVLPIYAADTSSPLALPPTPTPVPVNENDTQKNIETEELAIALYNGSDTQGITAKAEQIINSKYSNLRVVTKQKAQHIYEQNIIVDLSKKNETLTQDLAQEFSAQRLSLPEGEEKPKADVIIILGNQFVGDSQSQDS